MSIHDYTLESRKVEVLGSFNAFRGLPESQLETLARETECLSLNADDRLFEEGDVDDALYIVLSGTLQMFAIGSGGRKQALASFAPGDCIGETVVLFHRPRQATVYAVVQSHVLKFSLPLLSRLFEHYASVREELRSLASHRLLSFHLASSPLMEGVDIERLRMLDGEANWLRLAGGATLFEQGEPSDSMYVVVCGRLALSASRSGGPPEVIAHVGRGGFVGEMGLLTGEPRSATVRATRDTQLVRLSAEDFESLVVQQPQCMRQIAKRLATIVSEKDAGRKKARVATIALVSVASNGFPAGFVETLLDGLSDAALPAFALSSRRIEIELGPGAASSSDEAAHHGLMNWLAEYESEFPCVLLQCDPELSFWTSLCLRHADLILIVGPSDADSRPGPVEAALLEGQMGTSATRKELVLVHSDAARLPSGTSVWLGRRKVHAHHHVRRGRKSDYQRLARFLANKPVGVVLSGGGARGLAHIGALKALEDCGLPVDVIGGTSMGAAVAAQWAKGVDIPALIDIGADFGRNFRRRFFRDMTFPAVSLNSAHRFSSYLKDSFGDIRIEDLWIPYFCNSSNLSTAAITIHDEGSLWTSIRASASIPGIWPPVVRDGQMLVDGGVMDNLPVSVMRTRCAGPVIAIDVSPTIDLTVPSAPQSELSGWPMLWKRLNPFAAKTQQPHIFSILSRTSQLGSIGSAEATKKAADLYLQPPTSHVDFFDWKAAQRLIDLSYTHCREKIEQWQR